MRYRRKPFEVEATQWLKHDDHTEVQNCLIEGRQYGILNNELVSPGSWIIERLDDCLSRFDFISDEGFQSLYERVEE